MANDAYIIRGGLAGRERLRVLSRVMEPLTLELFARVGVRSGDRCLDAGCGGGDVTVVLAALVGDEGSVTGVDLDDTKIAIASEEAAAAGLTNVKYDTVGVHDLPYEDDFDEVVPHLTVAHASDGVELQPIAEKLKVELPLKARATEVFLMESVGERWLRRAEFGLGPAST